MERRGDAAVERFQPRVVASGSREGARVPEESCGRSPERGRGAVGALGPPESLPQTSNVPTTKRLHPHHQLPIRVQKTSVPRGRPPVSLHGLAWKGPCG